MIQQGTNEMDDSLGSNFWDRYLTSIGRQERRSITGQHRVNGQLHREDGPSIVLANGDEYWYLNDKLHRDDGPAAITKRGPHAWYSHGQRHRIGGPAVTYPNGTFSWYVNGKLHREDGPAMSSYIDKLVYFWYLDNELYVFDDYCDILNLTEEDKLILTLQYDG